MAELEQVMVSPTLEAMATYWQQSDWVRNLGASNIGHDCERQIWLQWRYALLPDFPHRILRLFQRGHNEEETMIAELRHAGVKVFGCQESIYGYKKHFISHPDGRAIGILEAPSTEHLLEFKTMSEKTFKDMKAKGCKNAQPKHYAQIQIQMHLTGLTRAFYLVVNKNTDELYAERIKYDKIEGERLQARVERIIDATAPSQPNKVWSCKWCDMRGLCFGQDYPEAKQTPELNCRTCVFSTPVEGGEWQCSKWTSKPIPKEFQLNGCAKHLLIPGILMDEVVGSDGETYVLYESGLLNFNDEYVTAPIKEDPDNYENTLTHGVNF